MTVWFRGERNVKWRLKVSKSNNVNVPETRYFCILIYDTVQIGSYVSMWEDATAAVFKA